MTPLQQLEQMKVDEFKRTHPNIPEYAMIKRKKSKSPSNELTANIIDDITSRGGWATRINTMGRVLNGKYIPGSTKLGTPDIIACIKGKFAGIEIKIKDKQSDVQKRVELDINKSGGYYFVCHNFDEWIRQYDELC